MSDSNSSTSYSGGGLGLSGVLGVVFIVLKLCHVIAWSWLWVLSPFWIHIGFLLLILLVGAIIAGLILMFKKS